MTGFLKKLGLLRKLKLTRDQIFLCPRKIRNAKLTKPQILNLYKNIIENNNLDYNDVIRLKMSDEKNKMIANLVYFSWTVKHWHKKLDNLDGYKPFLAFPESQMKYLKNKETSV
ncbi:MAG: hypothetical protein V3T09_08305 [bacterium]